MSGYNPSKQTWLNPNIEYIFNQEIIEYDMRDAGYSIIKEFKLLPDAEIQRLGTLPKGLERNKAVGILQRDNREFNRAFLDKFTEMRRIFIEINKITDDDIISVKKDAIFTIGARRRTRFGQIQFVPKNHYTSYVRLADIQNMELYYSSEELEIKGMGDVAYNRHRLFMIEFLKKLFGYLESKNPYVRRYMMRFIDDYKSMALSEEFYIEFNNLSRDQNPVFNYQHLIIPFVQIIQRELDGC